jgi:hypothetical protein
VQGSTVPVKHAHLFGGNTDNSYFQHQRIETVNGNENEDSVGESQRWDELNEFIDHDWSRNGFAPSGSPRDMQAEIREKLKRRKKRRLRWIYSSGLTRFGG